MKLKNWNDIYEYWISKAVPNMTFMRFEYGKHLTSTPWFKKNGQSQFYYNDNPILDTGAHLAGHLKQKPQELIDAYKIFAFLRSRELFNLYGIIEEPFKKNKEDLSDWWGAGAKKIIPYHSSINDYYDNRILNSPDNVKMVIDVAAQAWKDIANEWALIIIPKYMDVDSEEYNEYYEYRKKM
ncbi:MAG: hypothetical protein P4L51_22520 [Puia sp.]|nr:hypothetical protein [Puia sp.]